MSHQITLTAGQVVKINGFPIRLIGDVEAETGTDPSLVFASGEQSCDEQSSAEDDARLV